MYATLVTLGGSHDGGDQEGQLVAVNAQDLVGQEVNLANFPGLTGHSNVSVTEALQVKLACGPLDIVGEGLQRRSKAPSLSQSLIIYIVGCAAISNIPNIGI